ncbi:NADPH-dependent FMN reductase [Clostridium botulinum B str. Osaka05]|uniref:NADPH-dependent FMN reductase n=1 Tax=Clostridium botulinum B str. Osaka05 TaxID=1407017 RepID=A0A060N4P7_CLOBO|nr:hypothetical protein [Clostridium botulinum]BAO04737.1 NADPH-dependent FMN reductase [Clostridium botulinum B str. Osaka05]
MLKCGDVVVLKTPKEIQLKYGAFDKDGVIKVGSQVYTREMFEEYGKYLFVVKRVAEGDCCVIFFNNHNGFWYSVTTGMLKKKYKF